MRMRSFGPLPGRRSFAALLAAAGLWWFAQQGPVGVDRLLEVTGRVAAEV